MRVWSVANVGSHGYTAFSLEILDSTPINIHVTGELPAYRLVHDRLVKAVDDVMAAGLTLEGLEGALIGSIRDAASQANGKTIGKDCMAVTIGSPRVALARFHPSGEHSTTFGPSVAWYAGGRNIAVQGVEHLPAGPYTLVFNPDGPAVRLRPLRGSETPTGESLSAFSVRLADQRHRNDPVGVSNFMSIEVDAQISEQLRGPG